jgi:hypothetical protein
MVNAVYYATHKPEMKAYYEAHKTEMLAASKQYYKTHKEAINKRRTMDVYRSIFPHDIVTKKVEEVGLVAACAHFRVERAKLRKLANKDKVKTISPAAAAIKIAISTLRSQLKGL